MECSHIITIPHVTLCEEQNNLVTLTVRSIDYAVMLICTIYEMLVLCIYWYRQKFPEYLTLHNYLM